MVDEATKGFAVFVLLASALFPYWNPVPSAIWLGFVGDLMAPPVIQNQNDLSLLYEGVKVWLCRDDLNFINLESPIDPFRSIHGYPSFNAHPAYVEAAIDAGFDVFNLANNHANDFGWSSVRATLATMRRFSSRRSVAFSGLRETPGDTLEGSILHKNGWTVGFLGLTSIVNQPEGEEGVNYVPYHDFWGNEDRTELFAQAVKRVRELRKKVDWLVVALHDGYEYETQPRSWQKTFYNELAKAGADIVWVQHPHVLRPWWIITTSRGKSLILSSMGNFVSAQTRELGPSEGFLLRADTGDSCLMRIRVRYRSGSLVLDELQPVLLSQFYDLDGSERILPTENLARFGPVLWRSYYQARLERQLVWAHSGKF